MLCSDAPLKLFGSSIDPAFFLLEPPLAPFSTRLARHDGRAQGARTLGFAQMVAHECEKRSERKALKTQHYTGRIARNRQLFYRAKRKREKDREINE